MFPSAQSSALLTERICVDGQEGHRLHWLVYRTQNIPVKVIAFT